MSRVAHVPAIAAIVVASISAYAQERRTGGEGNGLPPYDVAKEQTVTGEVTGTAAIQMPDGTSIAVLNLMVNGNPLHVLLAPETWVKAQGISFATGTKVDATGLSNGLHLEGEPAMLARKIKAGTKTVELRGADGAPMWKDARDR